MIIVYRWLSFKDNGFGYFDFAVVLKADKNSRKHTSNLFEPRNTKCDSLLGPQYVCNMFVFQKKQLTVEAKPPCWDVFVFDSVVLWSSLASCPIRNCGAGGDLPATFPTGWGPGAPGPPATIAWTVGANNSNYGVWYANNLQITIVTGANLNQLLTGGPHIVTCGNVNVFLWGNWCNHLKWKISA